MPILRLDGEKQGVVVAVTDAGVHAYAAGELAVCPVLAGKRSVHHAAREVEATVIQVAIQAPDVLDGEVARSIGSLVGHHGRGATGKAVAVTGAGQCRFEEGLRSDCVGVANAVSTAHIINVP